jgi:GntR family transcriptional repressor for pyruvate dehydrogenase complex
METRMFKPLEKKRYSDQVAEHIQGRILKEHLEIGTGLPSEQELALEFQVSRSVIREALRILEVSGLVSIKKGPSGGIFVSNGYHKPLKKTIDNLVASGEFTLDHLFDVRLLIEPYIAGQAALHANDEDVKKLQDLIKDSSLHMDEPLYLKKNNLDFHLLLAKASGNPLLSILIKSVFEILIDLSLDFIDLPQEKRFYRYHKKIFEVISQKRPEEDKRIIEEDIKDIKHTLKKLKKREKEKESL